MWPGPGGRPGSPCLGPTPHLPQPGGAPGLPQAHAINKTAPSLPARLGLLAFTQPSPTAQTLAVQVSHPLPPLPPASRVDHRTDQGRGQADLGSDLSPPLRGLLCNMGAIMEPASQGGQRGYWISAQTRCQQTEGPPAVGTQVSPARAPAKEAHGGRSPAQATAQPSP